MKKISLVELSQMENKPDEVEYKLMKFSYKEDGSYKSINGNSLIIFMNFNEINEPLIEIKGNTLLTDEDTECLKQFIKYTDIEPVKISVHFTGHGTICILRLEDEEEGGSEYPIKPIYFKKLEEYEWYTLEELGIEVE